MKRSQPFVYKLSIVLILSITISFAPTQCADAKTDAQDIAKLALPEGARARLGKGTIHGIVYSADGSQLIVVTSIGIWTYNADTGKELALFNVRVTNAQAHAFSSDRRMFASASGDPDNTVHVFDLTNRQHKTTLKGHTSHIKSIAFSPDGRTLATGSSDDTVRLWDIDTGRHKTTLIGHTYTIYSVAFSPDGRTLATAGGWAELNLWDVDTGELKTTLPDQFDGLPTIAFSPDGRILATTSSNTNDVQLRDVFTGKEIQRLNTERSIKSLAFSPDSRTLATGGWRELYLWDLLTKNSTPIFLTKARVLDQTAERKATLTGHLHYDGVISAAFSPDGQTLASASADELLLWDSMTVAQKGAINGHTGYFIGFALSADGRTVATGNRGKIHLWDTRNATQQAVFYEDEWGNYALAFSPDGNILASEISPYIRLWDVKTGTHRNTLKTYIGSGIGGSRIYALAFSPDGRFFANAHMRRTNGSVWLWYAGLIRKSILAGHSDNVSALAFSPDSRTLATGSFDNTIRLWDVETDAHKFTLTGHTGYIESVAFSPDGNTLASASRDGTVRLWDTISGAHKATLTGYTNTVAFSPDGKTLASAGGLNHKDIQLWDVTTGTDKSTLTGHTREVSHIAFSPDGKTLISGSFDGTILLWNLAPATEPMAYLEDVNRDGMVNYHDLVFVASHFGESGTADADVNSDGIVNIVDLVLVAAALGTGDSAPYSHLGSIKTLTPTDVQQWLITAQQIESATPIFHRGIAVLRLLLTTLTPKETTLLPNYPNPFNPETWIPYQLATPADVTLRIYSASGVLVRTLVLGYQPAGIYQNRSRAAYWDGKNEIGEPVSSGVYFYTLSAGHSTMTRRMVIRK